jgi:hypothetical protein
MPNVFLLVCFDANFLAASEPCVVSFIVCSHFFGQPRALESSVKILASQLWQGSRMRNPNSSLYPLQLVTLVDTMLIGLYVLTIGNR